MYSWNGYLGPDIFPLDDWFKTQTLKQSIPDDKFCFDFDYNMDLNDSVRQLFLLVIIFLTGRYLMYGSTLLLLGQCYKLYRNYSKRNN